MSKLRTCTLTLAVLLALALGAYGGCVTSGGSDLTPCDLVTLTDVQVVFGGTERGQVCS